MLRSRAKASAALRQRDAVKNGTQIQLKRAFSEGQLVYTAPITIEGQELNVQIDTGSSDLWVASDRCNSAACQNKGGNGINLFSDNSGLETGDDFSIDYLVGSASGPIILSNVSFANTVVENQGFASCDTVENQQLSSMQASGIMGLALPSNSIIQEVLSHDLVNANNTQTNASMTGSILPGLWQGVSSSYRFFGLGLQRLPSDGGNGNSTLTFGDYDRDYLSATSPSGNSVKYSSAVPDDDGIVRKWQLFVKDFFVKVNGSQIQIPLSRTGANVPTAILDTGSPLNLASVGFLNAMYGAVNVGPAADGSGGYYVDCSLLLEISISVGGSLIPIHPLDSSLKQDNSGSGSGGSSGCIGSFQAVRSVADSDLPAQFILGAPFLRSVYSLYSCDSNSVNASADSDCSAPRIGLHALYNTSATYQAALDDFNKVRIQGIQLGDNSQVGGLSASVQGKGGFGSGAKIAVGVVVGLLGIVAIMAILLFILKKRRNKMLPEDTSDVVNVQDDKADVGGLGLAGLSEKERQKARELALLHGQFVEDQDGGRASPSTGADRTLGADSQSDWDISSKGYWEARAIKNEYQRRTRSQGPASTSQKSYMDRDQDQEEDFQESHELVDTSTFSPR